MTLRRLDLPDGQWADQLEKPKHAEYLVIMEAYEDALRGRDSWVNLAYVCGVQYTKAWSIRDPDSGADVKFGDWPQLDPEFADAMCTEAQNRWKAWDEARVPLVMPRPRRTDRTGTPEPSSESTPEAAPST